MRSLIGLTTALTLLSRVASQCYFPNGEVAGSDTICNPNALVSACCYDNQACMSNGLCMSDPHEPAKARLHRGTCSDKTWKSGACPRECTSIANNGVPVYSCNQTNVDSYCCFDNCKCNDKQYETFSFTDNDVYALTIIGEAFTQTHTSTAKSSATSSVTSSTTLSATSGASVTSSGTIAFITATSTSLPSASAAASSSNSTAIGIGVGASFGVVILVLAGGFFFWQRKKRNNAKDTENTYNKHPPHHLAEMNNSERAQPYYPSSYSQKYANSATETVYPPTRSEMDSNTPPVELSTTYGPVELPTGPLDGPINKKKGL